MTPEQQYLKQHGHKYIGAIEVEFEQSLSFHDDIWVCNRRYVMNAYMVYMLGNILPEVATPIFTPQEGEQFLKDLEEAVRLGLYGDETELVSENKVSFVFDEVQVWKKDLSITLGHNLTFNSAAYIDYLRSKGYKV